MGNELSKLFVTLGLNTAPFGKSLNSVQKNLNQMGKAMTGIGASITGSLGMATKMASDFDGAMREVNTMMQLGEADFQSFSDDVLRLATEMGVDAVDSANALYQAISAGVPKENALEFLRVATQAAIGGVTDTETAVDGLTTVLNAFKIPVSEAQSVADIMFTTVKGGKTTMEELSASLYNVAPVANSAGVSLEEVAASLATMTKQGVPTAQATTQLRSAILSLSAPTDTQKKALEELGLSYDSNALKTKGLSVVMAELETAADGDMSVLRKLLGSTEAVNAVLALTGDNATMATADLDAMANSSGAAEAAFNEIEKGGGRSTEALKETMEGLSTAIGDNLLPLLTDFVKSIKPLVMGIIDWVTANPALTRTLTIVAAAIGGVFVVLGPLLIMLPMFAAGFTILLGPVGLVIAAIAALIAIGVLVWMNWDKIVAFFQSVPEKLAAVWQGIMAFFDQNKWLAAVFPIIGIPALVIGHWEEIVDWFKGLPEKIGEAFSTIKDIILAPFRAAWKGIGEGINWLIAQLNKIQVSIPSWVPAIGGNSFGINLAPITLPSFKYGGIVPGPLGAPVPVMAHGGEEFSGVGNHFAGGAGGVTIHNHIAGSVITEREVGEITRRSLYQTQDSNYSLNFK